MKERFFKKEIKKMIGITSFGAYIPRLRLSRSSIVQGMGWFAPAIMAVSQGERSMCNWDEDSITMAVAAARDCLVGKDKATLDALYLASTTLPFADRQNAGIVAAAMNLSENIITQFFPYIGCGLFFFRQEIRLFFIFFPLFLSYHRNQIDQTGFRNHVITTCWIVIALI